MSSLLFKNKTISRLVMKDNILVRSHDKKKYTSLLRLYHMYKTLKHIYRYSKNAKNKYNDVNKYLLIVNNKQTLNLHENGKW